MLKLISKTFPHSADLRRKPFLLRWQPQRKKKSSLPLPLCGVFWERNSQVAAATTAWESQRAIWKAKWLIDDRSQLSPRGSVRGGCAGWASHTTHLWLTINNCGHQPSQTGKHWRQSIWQAALTLPLPPHALIVVRKPLSCFSCICAASFSKHFTARQN